MTDAHHETVEQVHADIEACDRALHELITAIVAYDTVTAPAVEPRQPIRATLYRDIDPERAAFEGLTRHAVRHALREGVRRIGREVHRLGGGTGAMMDSLVKVADMDPPHAGRRGAIMDSAFNGVGTGDERWWS